ncbi:chemokine-like receptor 1 [Tachyglossus aculeatus]|uniref:chemokine-like receptor 1 n=1 Tax=Tachyglossus aculeatus TaxID=9261 RepID=UPI0018F542BE|nr:chemokine-like receptor 1 [Tachyglossus aculeatus]XP_038619843.1 chemokine-like receptor 1 [Tachyglossus aculeatus]XP_038619844.1 chemokine-like receptor 1 [Tachyglossus aculeatus]
MATEDYNHTWYTDNYDPGEDSFQEVTEEASPGHLGVAGILSVVIYSAVCLLGILGNGLVIVITVFKMKKSVNTVWFLNLAVADFLFNIFLPLYIVYTAMNHDWIFGTAMCKVNSFLLIHNMYTSVFLLTTISFDRCISVVCPVWSQNHRNVRLAYGACAVIWVLAFFLSSPSLVFRDTALAKGRTTCFNNFTFSDPHLEDRASRESGERRHMAVNLTRFLGGFILPFIVITACYLVIVSKLKRNRMAKSKKPFKIIVAIIVTFFLCWSPYHALGLLELFYHVVPHAVFKLGVPLATALAVANSCMNPILYVFMGQDFKKFQVAIFSRLVNALSEETAHSSYLSHRGVTKMSSMNERSVANDRETSMV